MMVMTAHEIVRDSAHKSNFSYLGCRLCQPLNWHSRHWFGLTGIT